MIKRSAHPWGSDISGQLLEVHRRYHRWFGDDYDCGVLACVLCTAAAERLAGDPPWLFVVGGSGAAKTETIMPLTGAGAHAVSTINGEAALLSGTSKKDRAANATGGLLRQIGERGVLIIKDVTSILSMNRDTRALVLAALREIYDGQWSRSVGTDGGQLLTWKGRLVVIGAVTTAWDSAHTVVSTMGDRFLLTRQDSRENREAAARSAMGNVGQESTMREELKAAVQESLNTVNPTATIDLASDETDQLLGLADLVTRTRTAVERDYQGNPLYAHGLEMPTRFAKQLVQIARGGIALGMSRSYAMAAATRCAGDSMPPLRLFVLGDVAGNPATVTADVVKRLQLPRKTVDRVLQELHLLGLLVVEDRTWGTSTRWAYSLAEEISKPSIETLLSRKVGQECHHPSGESASQPPSPKVSHCSCGQELYLIKPGRKLCERCEIARRAAS